MKSLPYSLRAFYALSATLSVPSYILPNVLRENHFDESTIFRTPNHQHQTSDANDAMRCHIIGIVFSPALRHQNHLTDDHADDDDDVVDGTVPYLPGQRYVGLVKPRIFELIL